MACREGHLALYAGKKYGIISINPWLSMSIKQIRQSLTCSNSPFWSMPDISQYHTPPEMSLTDLGIHDDTTTLDFDGHAEIVVPILDVLKKLVEDNFFSESARPDEEALADINSVVRDYWL